MCRLLFYLDLPFREDHIDAKNISKSLGPMAAAMLNSTFIQGFELDDYHCVAPIHTSAVVLPSLFAAAQQEAQKSPEFPRPVDGASFLLAAIVGYEIGPRVGLGLRGAEMLAMGWHSGAIFGPPAAAAAVSKLFGLPAAIIEDAVGLACTQACGLSCAKYESMVKRMQHGFAARGGLSAAYMARAGFVGIKQVLERKDGYLSTFSQGSKRTPRYLPDAICDQLGQRWEIWNIQVKPYASCAGTHNTIDCVRALQEQYPEQLKDLSKIRHITAEMAIQAFKHVGWKPERPLNAIGAQMCSAYVAALQLVDGEVLPSQFSSEKLDQDKVWDLVEKIKCRAIQEFDFSYAQRLTIEFDDNSKIAVTLKAPRGVDPPLSNEDVLQKWRTTTRGVIDADRQQKIEDLILNIENVNDITVALKHLFEAETVNVVT